MWKEAAAFMTALVNSGLHTRFIGGMYRCTDWCTCVHAEASRTGLHSRTIFLDCRTQTQDIECFFCVMLS